jgi:hypothetical protein
MEQRYQALKEQWKHSSSTLKLRQDRAVRNAETPQAGIETSEGVPSALDSEGVIAEEMSQSEPEAGGIDGRPRRPSSSTLLPAELNTQNMASIPSIKEAVRSMLSTRGRRRSADYSK